jgi:hypothetical protein
MNLDMKKKLQHHLNIFILDPITLGSKLIGDELLFGLSTIVFGPPHCGFTK